MAAKTNTTINPATEEVIQEYTLMTDGEMLDILKNSRRAYESWSKKDLKERVEIIRNMAKVLEKHKTDIAELITREMGKVKKDALGEVDSCIYICNHEADNAERVLADEKADTPYGKALISYESMGVIFGIQPWNFPFYQIIRFTVASLLVGNTVLLKHAPNVWGAALKTEELFTEAGLPENVFRALLIDEAQSSTLIQQSEVSGVTFTGSPRGGSIVASQAAKNLKKNLVELGGNDAYIVLEDADIEKAAKQCVLGRTGGNGEVCVAAKRFIVVESVYDTFKEKVLEKMKQLKVGDPTKDGTDVGPIARKDLLDNLDRIVQKSIEGGANCALGGKAIDGKGYFYEVTVLEGPYPGKPGYDEELFGPVASLLKVKDEQEAIELSNNSHYGLGGGVFTEDYERGLNVARQIVTGMMNINGYAGAVPDVPFGGAKNSGYGREHGDFGLRAFTNVKSIVFHEK